ncbi:MAG: DUF1489 domain-containing protein [Parvularculaceae bacterium]|nr:DUF1489 domain-containing protein [Parvularculaceae bacterium]
MTLHLIKLCAGANGIEDLRARMKASVARNLKLRGRRVHTHETRMFPRRCEELLNGGSLYWVIRGVILVRQKIIEIEAFSAEDGTGRCAIVLDPTLVETNAAPRRAFQGWRYFDDGDAPRDLSAGDGSAPAALRARLAELGLL